MHAVFVALALARAGLAATPTSEPLVLYYTVRDFDPVQVSLSRSAHASTALTHRAIVAHGGQCMEFSQVDSYRPGYPAAYLFGPGSPSSAGAHDAPSPSQLFCPLYNDVVAQTHSGHPDFELHGAYDGTYSYADGAMYADGCSGSRQNAFAVNNLTATAYGGVRLPSTLKF